MKLGNLVEWERKRGEPIFQQDGRTIRPVSRVLSLWWRPYGGGVWNWPAAIEVEENGTIREIPIPNINLWAQAGIGLMVILVSFLLWTAGNSTHKGVNNAGRN